jgi:uncharacterized protein YukE
MKRKLLSIITCIGVIVSCCSTVSFAASESDAASTSSNSNIVLHQLSDGTWTNITSDNISSKLTQSKTATVTVAKDSEFESIYKTADTKYFQKTAPSTYVSVNKVSLPLNSYSSYQTLKTYGIPAEMSKDIASMAALAKQNNCNNAQALVFVSSSSAELQSSQSTSMSTASTQNTMPVITTTWNGMTFHSYQIYFTEMNTTWQTLVQATSTTQAILSAISKMAVMCAETNEQVGALTNLYSAGQTCLQAWQSTTGAAPIYGNSQNKTQVNVNYNIMNQYTFKYNAYLAKDEYGYATQKARINEVDYDTFLYTSTGGQRATGKTYPNTVYYSPNFLYPESKAFQYYLSGSYETVQGKISYGGTNYPIIFEFPNYTWPSGWPTPY